MIKCSSKYFNPEKIYLSGQVLMGWEEISENCYLVNSAGRNAKVYTEGCETIIDCEECDAAYFSSYFDLETDYEALERLSDKSDAFMAEALSFGQGIRILNQDLWETILSFIVSQNNNIPRIKKTIERIKAGKRDCPSPEEIYARRDELSEYGLGYRDDYIYTLVTELHEGSRALSFSATRELAYKELLSIKGIGPKVANCILLFGLHHMDCCPVDTWVKKIFERHYEGKVPAWVNTPYAGYYQQVAFFYERSLGE